MIRAVTPLRKLIPFASRFYAKAVSKHDAPAVQFQHEHAHNIGHDAHGHDHGHGHDDHGHGHDDHGHGHDDHGHGGYLEDENRCDFLERPEVEMRVMHVLRQILKVDHTKLHPTAKFDDIGLDSLDRVEVTMLLEEEFATLFVDTGKEWVGGLEHQDFSSVDHAVDFIVQLRDGLAK